jgi:tetratricopeptide (TPR) repeat protein
MKPMPPRRWISLAALTLALLPSPPLGARPSNGGAFPQQAPATEGEQPFEPVQIKFPVEFRFNRPTLPDLGIETLEQLQGRPTLAAFWRLDDPGASARWAALRTALGERSGRLWLLGLERSSEPVPAFERRLWDERWTDGGVLFSREEAIPRRFQHPAQLMLLSHEGKVVFSGPWGDDLSAALAAIDQALAAAHHPAGIQDKKLLEAWQDFRAGKWERAYSSAVRSRDKARERLAKKPSDQEALAMSTQAGSLAFEIEAEAQRRSARCRLLAERGDFAQAKGLMQALKDLAPKESKEIGYLLADLEPRFEGQPARKELQAAARFAPLEALLHSDGVPAHRPALGALLAELPPGFTAARIQRLLELYPE